MSRVLEMMWESILTTWTTARVWITGIVGEGGFWLVVLVAVLLLVMLLLLLLPDPNRKPLEKKPELLVSRGEVRALEQSTETELTMHVSNLGSAPVQLLEVALSSDLMPKPETVELSVLVQPSRSVDVNLSVEELHGDTGFLDLYFYTPQSRKRGFRLRAELAWEPWNGRFKVEPLGQRIDPARRLASSNWQRRQREEWRRRQRELAQQSEAVEGDEPQQVEPEQSDEPAAERERLHFPSDF